MIKKLDRAVKRIYREVGAHTPDGKYGLLAENRYMIDVYTRRARYALYGCKPCKTDGELAELLREKRYGIEQGELESFLSLCEPDDEFLSTLHARLIYACVIQLEKTVCDNDTDYIGQILTFMLKCEELDYGLIYVNVSKTEKILLKNNTYKISDEKTRAEYRRQLRIYAKKYGMSIQEAAKSIVYEDIDTVLFDNEASGRAIAYFSILLSVFALFLFLCCVALDSFSHPLTLVIVALLSFSFYDCAKFLVDYSYSKLFLPRGVMRIDEKYIGDEQKTLIVITALLSGKESDKELFSHLEDMCLSNKENIFSYGILADLCDSDDLTHPEDESVLNDAKERIDRLNKKYGDRFYLFYRDREYSAVQGKFIPPERKRGAVIELSKKLYTGHSKLETLCGDEKKLNGTKYVITLDSDTLLPPGEGMRMVLAAAHPHNVPVTDEKTKTVVKGHGIFQPDIATCLQSGVSTGFALLTSGGGGFDSYANASYETYGQVFDQSNFCGKGIFDVRAFFECIPDAFCDGVILSHDLLEGMYLRCGALNDVILYDNTPSNALSYYKREARWIRGDVQSMTRIWGKVRNKSGEKIKNPLSALSKYKLFDNVRRALTPLFSFSAFLLALAFSHRCAAATSVFCVFYIILPTVVNVTEMLFFSSVGIVRKYYSYALSSFWHSLFYMFCRISQLPKAAVCALSSAYLSCVRLVSGKHLLDWVSAAGAEKLCKNLPGAYMISYAVSLVIGITVSIFVRCGLYRFFGLLFVASPFVMFALSHPLDTGEKNDAEFKEKAKEYAKKSFSYFERFVTEEAHYLPPDNVSEVGREPVAYRTSPTNIGLYMLSCLCAADFGLIDKAALSMYVSRTLDTVEGLKKYEGNLYNWYDIRTLEPLSDFVSSVDSGNFCVCMLTLARGLEEYGLTELSDRINRLNDECHTEALFNKRKQLFAIGADVGKGLTPSHYDIYMSESRSMYYYAASRGEIPPGSVGVPSRMLLSEKGHIGLGSWSGTCFEYFMPTLFLPLYKNSMLWESAEYALRAQMKNGVDVGGEYVFGISESCYNEYDADMNYQYKAHGIQSLSLRYSQYDDRVISPYSSFLMIGFSPRAIFGNLEKLKKLGGEGEYGFYEAIDCTFRSHGYEIIRCYMSHHIGMSICALANYRFDGILRRRFMSDPAMRAHRLMLSERVAVDEAPFEPSSAPITLKSAMSPECNVPYCGADHGVLSNTKTRIMYSNEGRLYIEDGDVCITRRSPDRTLGFRIVAHDGLRTLSLPEKADRCVCEDGRAMFGIGTASVTAHPLRKASAVCLKIESESPTSFGFEPVLCKWEEYIRHISFSRLFVCYEMKNGVLTFIRKNKDGGKEYCMSLILLDENGIPADYKYQAVFDRILPANPAGEDMAEVLDGELYDSTEDKAEACVQPYLFCRCNKKKYYALMTFGYGKEKVISELETLRAERIYPDDHAIFDTASCGDEGQRLVYGMMFPHRASSRLSTKSGLDVSELWRYGISGEDNVFLIDLRACDENTQGIEEYISNHLLIYKKMLVCGMRYTVVILYDGDGYNDSVHRCILQTAKNCGVALLLGIKNGIIPICERDEKLVSLILDSAFCSIVYPSHTLSAHPAELPKNEIYPTAEVGKRVSSFVYATKTIGTVLTSETLGFTFFRNSHFNRITEFFGDEMERKGESICLDIDGKSYDLCRYAERISMNTDHTVYEGRLNGIPYSVTVSLHPKLPMKTVAAVFDRSVNVIYRASFLLSEMRRTVDSLASGGDGKKLLTVTNVYSTDKYSAFLYCKNGEQTRFDGENGSISARGKLFSFILGAYENTTVLRLCVAGSEDIRRSSYQSGVDEISSVFSLTCRDRALEFMFNKMALYQVYYCRMLARCGFYQNGGAYGFRDQLQDSLCILYVKPEETKRQIYRCARHQYEEGDVMHWFHTGREVGVRTRCSDDLLWLVYAVHRYVTVTGDTDILFDGVYYIHSRPLGENEDDRYEKAVRSDVKESLYMHCVRAVERSMRYGDDGLPLFGSGDWNDGMNKVEGQSVWLGWFLCDILERMSALAKLISDEKGESKYKAEADRLRNAVESFAYNGKYYIRGTYKSGEVIGAKGGCKIDILPQAFAAFTGNRTERIASALNAAYSELYDDDLKLVKLLTPPFAGEDDAGYISQYPMGIRENGGQYTHGAVWLAMALLKVGDGERGYRLLRAISPPDRDGDERAKGVYGGEKYVFAGDVYTAPGHEGRCGWSWYTGAAGWYCQAVLRYLLGYEEHGNSFTLDPCLSDDFPEFELRISKNNTVYTVFAERFSTPSAILDGKPTKQKSYPFDHGKHELVIRVKKHI